MTNRTGSNAVTEPPTWHWVVCNTCIDVNTYRVDRDDGAHITWQWIQEHTDTTGHDDWHGSEFIVDRRR